MEISQLSFVLMSIYSLCFGGVLGIIYDVIRIQRVIFGIHSSYSEKYRRIELPIIKKRAYKEKNSRFSSGIFEIYVAIGDILFMLAFAMISVLIAYAYNSGRIRLIIFAGILSGFLIYYFTVGKLVMRISGLLAFLIRSTILYLTELIEMPVRFIIRQVKNTDRKKKGAKNDEHNEQTNNVRQ